MLQRTKIAKRETVIIDPRGMNRFTGLKLGKPYLCLILCMKTTDFFFPALFPIYWLSICIFSLWLPCLLPCFPVELVLGPEPQVNTLEGTVFYISNLDLDLCYLFLSHASVSLWLSCYRKAILIVLVITRMAPRILQQLHNIKTFKSYWSDLLRLTPLNYQNHFNSCSLDGYFDKQLK